MSRFLRARRWNWATRKSGINSSESQQLLMTSLLRNQAAIQDDDFIGIANRAQTVRNRDHRSPFHQPFRLDHQLFGLGIESGSRLIKIRIGIIPNQGACNPDALPLSS